jgi:hypothetical protein
MDTTNAEETILAAERRALDRWSAGDPAGYAESAADDVSYFDDIWAHDRIDGGEALRAYAKSLEGQIPVHSYAMARPRVQLFEDIGILTYRYVPTMPNGETGTLWKATTVYRRRGTTGDSYTRTGRS